MRRTTLVLLTLFAFVAPAMAKPSDWDDVIEKPGDRSALPPPSKNAPSVVANAKTVKAAKQTKKTKTKQAPRRAKAKRSRR